MNIFFAILMICGGVFVGLKLSQKFRKKEQIVVETILLIDLIKNKINFSLVPLDEILKESLAFLKSPLRDAVETLRQMIANSEMLTYENLSEKINIEFITKDEKNLFIQLFERLGKSDAKSQTQSLEEFKSIFERLHKVSFANKNKYQSTYLKVGVLCGIGLAIFII